MNCTGTCSTQCDDCHTLENCVEGPWRWGDLLLCSDCRRKYPIEQPWYIDPETGECIDSPTSSIKRL